MWSAGTCHRFHLAMMPFFSQLPTPKNVPVLAMRLAGEARYAHLCRASAYSDCGIDFKGILGYPMDQGVASVSDGRQLNVNLVKFRRQESCSDPEDAGEPWR